eukprot:1355429-Rhodomonas_salina.2
MLLGIFNTVTSLFRQPRTCTTTSTAPKVKVEFGSASTNELITFEIFGVFTPEFRQVPQRITSKAVPPKSQSAARRNRAESSRGTPRVHVPRDANNLVQF